MDCQQWWFCGFWMICVWSFGAKGCPDELRYRISFRNQSKLLDDFLSNYALDRPLSPIISDERTSPTDPSECARLCYDHPLCHGAVFFPGNNWSPPENNPNLRDGRCILLPHRFSECNGNKSGPIPKELFDGRGEPVLLNCFSCGGRTADSEEANGQWATLDEATRIREMREYELLASGILARLRNGSVSPLAEEDNNRGIDGNGDEEKEEGRSQRRKRSREFSLRVMTFNTWLSGDSVDLGLEKIAKHILVNNVDIVFLQEMADHRVQRLLDRLDRRRWSLCSRNAGRLNHIVTRQRVVREYEPATTFLNNGCQIQFYPPNEDFLINVWNVHLYPDKYGPYRACSQTHPMQTDAELWDSEANPNGDKLRSRINNIFSLAQHLPFNTLWQEAAMALADGGAPLLVAGDFNAPSHLDWIDQARDLHCNWVFEWPVSKFMERMGFVDSYRVVFPDPSRQRGATWSSIYKDSTDEFVDGRPIREPQDRIDFIYYKSDRLQVIDSYVYAGPEFIREFPNHVFNDWPSDHSSVVTHFAWSETPYVARRRSRA